MFNFSTLNLRKPCLKMNRKENQTSVKAFRQYMMCTVNTPKIRPVCPMGAVLLLDKDGIKSHMHT